MLNDLLDLDKLLLVLNNLSFYRLFGKSSVADPDPLLRGADPDLALDPSIIKQNKLEKP